jgi:predicted nucleic acid-binding protein
MNGPVVLDTGPLVASIDRRDEHHAWTVEQSQRIPPPMLTCEPVITEACFLLAHQRDGRDRVLDLVRRGDIAIALALTEQVDRIQALMAKYADQPMSLADACLVRMAELHARSRVFTLDRHFRIYRMHGRKTVSVIMP